MVKENKEFKAFWNISEKFLQDIWINFVQEFFNRMDQKNYEGARDKLYQLDNVLDFYTKKYKKTDDIKKFKETINCIYSEKFNKARIEKDIDTMNELSRKHIQGLYDLMRLFNNLMASKGFYLPLVQTVDDVEASMRMTK